jgi:hypothetical protein
MEQMPSRGVGGTNVPVVHSDITLASNAVIHALRRIFVAVILVFFINTGPLDAANSKPVSYDVWGGNYLSYDPTVSYYNVDQIGSWTYLGSANQTDTFSAQYKYYIVAVKPGSDLFVDAVRASDDSYYSGNVGYGNAVAETRPYIHGEPDGYCLVMRGTLGGGHTYGAYIILYNPGTWTSLRIFVEDTPIIHDLAVTAIKPSKAVTLTAAQPVQTKYVKVTIQNRSSHDETIPDWTTLQELVTLEVESLGQTCPSPVAVLVEGPPQRPLPATLKPKQKFTVVYKVTYDCANDPAKNIEGDFRYIATVDREVLDSIADMDPSDDVCPRNAPVGGMDLLTSSIKDKGAGGKKLDGTLGTDVLTDVVVK